MTNQKNFSVFIRILSHICEIASNRRKEVRNINERFIFLLKLTLRNELNEGEQNDERIEKNDFSQ